MTISEINSTIAALNIIKATVEWDYPLDYQLDIDKAIEGLKELKKIKETPTCGKCVKNGTYACSYSVRDENDTEICSEYLTEEEDGRES